MEKLTIKTKKMEVVKQEGTELIKRKDVKDSPFVVISLEETKEHFGVLGKYRITEKMESVKAVEKELSKVTWDRIVQIILILNENNK